MNRINLIAEMFGFTRNTYFNWKKENRKIIKLIDKYFTNEELKEFLETGRISSKEALLKEDIKFYINDQVKKEVNEALKALGMIKELDQIDKEKGE